MKRNIFLLTCLISLLAFSNVCINATPYYEDNNDYSSSSSLHPSVPEPNQITDFHWGDSKETVMQVRGHAFIVVLTDYPCKQKKYCIEKMVYPQTLENALRTNVSYYFMDDALFIGTIEVTQNHINADTAVLDYDVMLDFISSTRGTPIVDLTDWFIEHKGIPTPQDIANGDAGKYAEWDDTDNLATLSSFGVNGKVKTTAEFYLAKESQYYKGRENLCEPMDWTPKIHTCRPSLLYDTEWRSRCEPKYIPNMSLPPANKIIPNPPPPTCPPYPR